jgi:hypothetical protein
MGSSQDEFADALRNAHLPTDQEVYVLAHITATDGAKHQIKRILESDYGKKHDCTSRLEIDGVPATEIDLGKLGIVLSQPPLQAPVLAQHTLSYIFSVRPQDRATYFKALLEVTDLDNLRNSIAALAEQLRPLDDPLLTKFDNCVAVSAIRPIFAQISSKIPDLRSLTTTFSEAARTLIETAADKAPDTLDDRLLEIERILTERRSKTFLIQLFEFKDLAGWNPPSAEIWNRIDSYIGECKKVDERTRQLAALFGEALKLPSVSGITAPVQCPLCAIEASLTPERVQLIRHYVENISDFNAADLAARSALIQLSGLVESLAAAVNSALPSFTKLNGVQRRRHGFTIDRIRELLGDNADTFVAPWVLQARRIKRAGNALRLTAKAGGALVQKRAADITALVNTDDLLSAFDTLVTLRANFAAAVDAYKLPDTIPRKALNEILDVRSDTACWQDFLDTARQVEKLRVALIKRDARASVENELETALKQIDRAKEQVLDDKFSDHSVTIEDWWNRLRPGEPTFFSAVQPRKGAKRTIDFKAGLSANLDRSSPKMRDVIAVFSQSQLHCLGLAVFLARAQYEELGFIILDEPVLSSDEDYRVHFNTEVLSELLKLPVQVIILTQDHDTWEELETRYRHLSISTAQLFIETPAEGTIIENTSDTLLAKISRAKSLARGGHPDSRKECGIHLRDAGERFCKEMLVKHQRKKGEIAASLTDYDEKTLEWLCPRVDPLLDQDPSHPGKLEAFKDTVNHACHDNSPPNSSAMTHACGEIAFLQKQYLAR